MSFFGPDRTFSADPAESVEEVHSQDYAENAYNTVDHRGPPKMIAPGDFSRLQAGYDILMLTDRIETENGREDNKCQAHIKGNLPFKQGRPFPAYDIEKKTETLDHKPEGHKRNACPVPGQLGPLSGKKDPGIMQLRHGSSPLSQVSQENQHIHEHEDWLYYIMNIKNYAPSILTAYRDPCGGSTGEFQWKRAAIPLQHISSVKGGRPVKDDAAENSRGPLVITSIPVRRGRQLLDWIEK